jgi:hypothetical protein
VYALRVGDVADDFAVAGIDDDDVSGARDEEVMRGGIDFEVVPAAGAAQFNLLEKVVAGRAGGLRAQRRRGKGLRYERRREEQEGKGHKKG